MLTAGSSGPLVAWGAGMLGWWLWRYRRHTRTVLWTLAGIAVVIHFIRAKPVWSLIGKVSHLTGGTGYHRYRLIDAFINQFSEWAILGVDTTAHWGWGLQDLTNQYVAQGVKGGLVTLVLFVYLLHVSFTQLRSSRIRFERTDGLKSLWALLPWGFSVSLAVHCVSFMSVSYFGQMKVFFVMFLGLIPALAKVGPGRTRVRSTTPVQSRMEPPGASQKSTEAPNMERPDKPLRTRPVRG